MFDVFLCRKTPKCVRGRHELTIHQQLFRSWNTRTGLLPPKGSLPNTRTTNRNRSDKENHDPFYILNVQESRKKASNRCQCESIWRKKRKSITNFNVSTISVCLESRTKTSKCNKSEQKTSDKMVDLVEKNQVIKWKIV